MKKIFKLMPVALAAFALASCSSDDLFSDGAKQQKVKDGLTVNVETLMDEGSSVTRQGNVATGNGVVWEVGDLINVYDNKLAIYDEYAFDGGKFAGINDPDETRIASTQFALFPADRVDYAGWRDGKTKAVMRIPQLVIYDEESEFQTGDPKKDVYVSNLPMWGTATGTYPEAEVSMKFLTSVLKVNIVNAFANNITFLKVETQDETPISGAFEATLDAENPDDAKLGDGATSLTTSNVMYVDLRNVPSYMTYIYLPIIARHYDYMKVMVTSAQATEASALEENSDLIVADLEKLPAAEWTTIRNWEAGVDFTKSSVKPLTKETQYTLDNVSTCEMISKALQQYSKYEGILTLNVGAEGNKGLQITRLGDVDDYTIYVPAMAASKVILNIPDGLICKYSDATVPAKLEIVDANIKTPYTGEIELNASQIQTATTNPLSLTVNLPKTDFTLAGNFNGAKWFTGIDVKNVDVFTVGNGVDASDIAYDTKLTVSTAKEFIVADKASVRCPVDLVETKNLTDVRIEEGGKMGASASLAVLNADVHVQGTVQYRIYQYSSQKTVFIGEDAADGQVGNIYTIGKVNIANKNESEAITGKLSVLGNNTITLKQGYVKSIVYDNSVAGFKPGTAQYDGKYVVKNLADLSASDYTNKLVKVTFAPNEGLTAINVISDDLLKYSAGGNVYNWLQFTNASTWCGKVIDATNFATYADPTSLNRIYTAAELATPANADGIKYLYNNIDLNSKQWTNPTLRRGFNGLDPRYATATVHKSRLDAVTAAGPFTPADSKEKGIHTIKNLMLQNTQDGLGKDRKQEFGLFGVVVAETQAITVQNFILDGVTCDLAVVGSGASAYVPNEIGAVAGVLSAMSKNPITFQNIWVKNAAIGGDAIKAQNTKDAVGIRAASTLIGWASAFSTVSDVKILGNKIESSSVTGQARMGGLIGYDKNQQVWIDGNNVATTFTVPATAVPSSFDFAIMDCATVGMAVGQYDASNATDFLKISTVTANTFADNITNNRAALGFKYNFLFEASTKYAFYGGNILVGYSPNFTDETLIVNSGANEVKYKKEAKRCKDKAEFTALAKNLKQNAYIQWTPWEE